MSSLDLDIDVDVPEPESPWKETRQVLWIQHRRCTGCGRTHLLQNEFLLTERKRDAGTPQEKTRLTPTSRRQPNLPLAYEYHGLPFSHHCHLCLGEQQ